MSFTGQPLDTFFDSGMMETYTLKYYTKLMNRHQRLESRGATRMVAMHTKARKAWPYGLMVLAFSLMWLVCVDGQPLPDRLPLLWSGLLP